MLSELVSPEVGPKIAPDPMRIPPADLSIPCAIDIKELRLFYDGRQAVNCSGLRVEKGSVMALVGPSGCGKSSILSCINRMSDLVPNCRVEGQILIDKIDVLDKKTNVKSLRKRVGMVFQRPNPFPKSIRENLALPLREHGIRNRAMIEEKIERDLRDVGLWNEVYDRLDSPPMLISGGQQQRLCIARAIVLEPEIILLDEPCSALDPISASVVEEFIVGLKGRYTIVVVTHNLAQARRIADSVSVCWVENDCGCLVESGDVNQIFSKPLCKITQSYIQGLRG